MENVGKMHEYHCDDDGAKTKQQQKTLIMNATETENVQ